MFTLDQINSHSPLVVEAIKAMAHDSGADCHGIPWQQWAFDGTEAEVRQVQAFLQTLTPAQRETVAIGEHREARALCKDPVIDAMFERWFNQL